MSPDAKAPGKTGHGPGQSHGHGHGGHSKGHAPPPAAGPCAPLWMLSFADMMTNLLCFFILMSAMSKVQQGLQFEDWLGSIRNDLLGLGQMGVGGGHRIAFQFGAGRVLYRAASPVNTKTLVEADGRILDSNRDALREVVVDALKQSGRSTLPTPLLFDPGSTELSAGHRAFLDEILRSLVAGKFPIRIDGYSFDEGLPAEQGWDIAEARARNVADHLAAGGIDPARLQWTGFGMMHYGSETRVVTDPMPQNVYGRRAALITLLP